jgi:hypothetical protein
VKRGQWRPTWRTHRVAAALADGGWMTVSQVWRAGPSQAGISYATVRDALGRMTEHGLAEHQLANRYTPVRAMVWRASPAGLLWGLDARKTLARDGAPVTVTEDHPGREESAGAGRGDVPAAGRESAGRT